MRADSPGSRHVRLDDDAGPVVRRHTVTGGRMRPRARGLVAVHQQSANTYLSDDDIFKAVASGLRAL